MTTIVVLIILTTVAIQLSLGNNGIFNRAKTAKEQYQNATQYEESHIAKSTNKIDSYIMNTRNDETELKSETIFSGEANTLNQTYKLSKSLENFDELIVQIVGYYNTKTDGNYRIMTSNILIKDNLLLYKSRFHVGGYHMDSYSTWWGVDYGINFVDSTTFKITDRTISNWSEVGITNILGVKH